MREERLNLRNLQALSETFKKWGWDGRVPNVISRWGEFHCFGNNFKLRIKDQEKKNWVTEVSLVEKEEQAFYSGLSETGKYLRICWEGRDLSDLLGVPNFPVSKITLVEFVDPRGKKKEAIRVIGPLSLAMYTITKDGCVHFQCRADLSV